MRPKHVPGQLLTLVALLMLGCAVGADKREVPSSQRWTSRAIPEARGEVKEIEGKRVQIRYRHEPFSTFTVRGLNRETMFHYLAAFCYRNPGLTGLNILRAMPALFRVEPKRIRPEAQIMDLIYPLRAVSIACGTVTILALYLFARWRFGWRVALLAALLLAVSPWHLLYSRVGYRTILAPLFAIATLAAFLRALESGRLRDHLAWGTLAGLGLWTYTSFRAIPLALAAFLVARRLAAWRATTNCLSPPSPENTSLSSMRIGLPPLPWTGA